MPSDRMGCTKTTWFVIFSAEESTLISFFAVCSFVSIISQFDFFGILTEFAEPYCNATWDRFKCWPATPANTIVELPCPDNFQGIPLDSSGSVVFVLFIHMSTRFHIRPPEP